MIIDVVEALALRCKTIQYPGAPTVYSGPKEATTIAEFPTLFWSIEIGAQHSVSLEAAGDPGLDRHNYTLNGYLFVGARSSGLPDLHDRIMRWFQPIGPDGMLTLWSVLRADIQLGGLVEFIGAPDSAELFRWQPGPIEWAKELYWGARIWLPVTEKHQTPPLA